jgi:hypothetical protein
MVGNPSVGVAVLDAVAVAVAGDVLAGAFPSASSTIATPALIITTTTKTIPNNRRYDDNFNLTIRYYRRVNTFSEARRAFLPR